MFWAPCIVLPLMGIIKLIQWIFEKLFGQKPTEDSNQTTNKVESGCPLTQMKQTLGFATPAAPATTPSEADTATKKVQWEPHQTID